MTRQTCSRRKRWSGPDVQASKFSLICRVWMCGVAKRVCGASNKFSAESLAPQPKQKKSTLSVHQRLRVDTLSS